MNIQDLKYYHALVKLKSYTSTAKKFKVSQPTISAAVKRLENQFNSQFFIRDQSHKSLVVTKLGMQFDKHVQSILNEMSVAQKEFKQEPGADILFGLPPIIGDHYFTKIAPQLLAHHILNHLQVIERGSYELRQMLIKGKINIAMLGLDNESTHSALEIKVLGRYPVHVIVSHEHPWAKRSGVYFKELVTQKFIALTDDYVHTQALNEMQKRTGIRLDPIYHSPDVPVVRSLVAKNLGVSYLTTLATESDKDIVSLPLLDDYRPSFLLAAAKRKNYLLNEKEEQLWNALN